MAPRRTGTVPSAGARHYAPMGHGDAVLSERTKAFIGRRADTIVGVLIVAMSVFGAYVTWRAAAVAGAASDFDRQSRQAGLLAQQDRGEVESEVSYEDRLYESFRAHLLTADALERDTANVDRDARAALRNDAATHRAIARALELPFGAAPVAAKEPGDPSARPAFDATAQLRAGIENDVRLGELRPGELRNAADRAREKRLGLVGVDTVVIASLFFLTLALLAARVRFQFAVTGGALAAMAVVSLVVVQVVINVPTS